MKCNGLANLRAQTSSDMPSGGLVLKRSGMEEGEARRAVNSSAISATVTICLWLQGIGKYRKAPIGVLRSRREIPLW